MEMIVLFGAPMLAIYLIISFLKMVLSRVTSIFTGLRPFTANLFAIDGDTVMVQGASGKRARRFRVLGIDAPEMRQEGGEEAKAAMRLILEEGPVRVIPEGLDKYGRALARLRDKQGKDIGLRLVQQGYARGTDTRGKMIEIFSRMNRSGLWAKSGISDPAAWRRRNKK